MIDQLFTRCSAEQLRKNAESIEKCLARLDDRQIWMRGHESENAVGNLLLHLTGNVRQWIIAGVGNTPDIRDRDSEFNTREGLSKADLVSRLRATVEEACGVIDGLSAGRLEAMVRIQNHDLTVLEAVYHVVEHFGQHTGQILFATKLLTGKELGFTTHAKRPA
jgi:uncharacterized damage-inducible protein DinB